MRATRERDRSREDGAVAVFVALIVSSLLLVTAAFGVDMARWWVEEERVQTAADAAALAGVVFLPDNMPRAIQAAQDSAELNGYENGVNATVRVEYGERRSQLKVTILTDVDNRFGATFGIDTTTVGRSAVADYTSPAPMGSPCNTFGNEPLGGNDSNSGPRAQQSTCNSRPNLWGAIEGPDTDKASGDRYMTTPCGPPGSEFSPTYACANNRNSEATYPEGYFYAVKVDPAVVEAGQSIRLQVFDPIFYGTGTQCDSAVTMPSISSTTSNTLNDYVSDARTRYAAGSGADKLYCTGDTLVNSNRAAPVTSFALRSATDSQDPTQGAAVSGCTAQFRGYSTRVPGATNTTRTTNALTKDHSLYNDSFAKTWRQWVDLCTFTPTRSGNYFIQVRTNVELGGTAEANGSRESIIFRNNNLVTSSVTGNRTSGNGANAFGLRAITPQPTKVTVSGWARMPMLQNAPGQEATFHLLRVLPSAAGQSISFEFFDAADVNEETTQPGKVTVLRPADATGTITGGLRGCQQALNNAAFSDANADCSVGVSRKSHNGQLQRMSIPIPDDYNCSSSSQTGCWFTVRVELAGTITDFTTWDASLEGDPVRLIE